MEIEILFEVSVPGAQLRFFEIKHDNLIHDNHLAKALEYLGLRPCGPTELKEANERDERVAKRITATHWKPRYPNSYCHAVYKYGEGGPLGSPIYEGGCFPPGTIFAGKKR